ncbi:ROK family transcriptional regulator [Streptomyces sp. NPDC000410]|uniref:ROK family transcriptional regulator n=1 Tax=Streptomyces sp. NPDC000410 TaxID=3154254 RepID=UPI00331CB227
MKRSNAGANLPVLRGHNAALVLDLLRGAGGEGISRLEIADGTGLTPQAVSKITARLRAEGLATEAGRRASTGGKPRTVLCLVPSAAHAVGLHLDRDELTAVLVDLAGTVVASRTRPLELGGGATARVLAAAEEEVRGLLGPGPGPWPESEPGARSGSGSGSGPGSGSASGAGPVPGQVPESVPGPGPRVVGVGVAMPGPLDHVRGVPRRVTGAAEWDGVPVRDVLAERLGLPVVLDKDTNAAALGLALKGAGDSFAYLHLGTGLGAGLVLGGALHRGARTGAGEFGHQVVQLDGPECECGNRGCVEVLCLAAVGRGDLDGAARVLGVGAGNLVRLLDVDRVLLGGRTVAAAPEVFVRGVREATAADVALADAGAYPVAEGAAQLVLATLFGR